MATEATMIKCSFSVGFLTQRPDLLKMLCFSYIARDYLLDELFVLRYFELSMLTCLKLNINDITFESVNLFLYYLKNASKSLYNYCKIY